MEVTAVIVARSGSVRIKNKSMSMLGGKTLINRKIDQLLACRHVDRVVFGSNSVEMLDHAEACGAETIRRPDYFCDEQQATANEMIGNMCSLINTDIVLWAHCTNPFISSETYDRAISLFLENYPKFDSLLSVLMLKEHLWGGDMKPLNYNPASPVHTPARDLPPVFMQDGGVFIQRHEDFVRNSYFFGDKPYLFQIDRKEFMDINDEHDLWSARRLLGD